MKRHLGTQWPFQIWLWKAFSRMVACSGRYIAGARTKRLSKRNRWTFGWTISAKSQGATYESSAPCTRWVMSRSHLPRKYLCFIRLLKQRAQVISWESGTETWNVAVPTLDSGLYGYSNYYYFLPCQDSYLSLSFSVRKFWHRPAIISACRVSPITPPSFDTCEAQIASA